MTLCFDPDFFDASFFDVCVVAPVSRGQYRRRMLPQAYELATIYADSVEPPRGKNENKLRVYTRRNEKTKLTTGK
jgi:hypothetical protein